MAYRAILFDLFDTLVRFDRERLPLLEVNGRRVRSTASRLHEVLRSYAPDVTLGALYEALLESWQDAERRRAVDHREVAAAERFGHLLECLRLDPGACPPDLVPSLLEAHRRELSKAAEFPPHHARLLAELARDHRLAVVSNFDYTPTAVGLLEAAGVAGLFDAIVVSDVVGWRKPAPQIFEEALRRVAARPDEALFVGDRVEIDVVGARAIGMAVAWLNPGREPAPPGMPTPDFEIVDLAELRAIVRT